MFWLVYRYKLQREASYFVVAGHICVRCSHRSQTSQPEQPGQMKQDLYVPKA